MTTRAPASLVVTLLAREAAAKGRPELAVKPATLRSWKHRGYLSPGRGYILDEIVALITRRDTQAGRV